MLIQQKDVLGLLRCPRSGVSLNLVRDKLVASNESETIEYDITGSHPVLIDYCNSVLETRDIDPASPVVERHFYRGALGIIKRIVSPPKKITAQNVDDLMKLLIGQNDNAKVLIIGGGTIGQGMKPFYRDPRIDLVSFDIYASKNVHFLADAHNIPLPDTSFDAVIIQAVLEHVLDPQEVVAQIYRVLKSGGLVYAETPFLQHVHEGAYDFTRFTESGHRYLFKNFGLIKSGASAGAGTQLVWSLDNFFRGLFRSNIVGKIVKLSLFWLQYFDRIIPDSYNIDSASGVFFFGKKQESEISKREAITHYKGAQK